LGRSSSGRGRQTKQEEPTFRQIGGKGWKAPKPIYAWGGGQKVFGMTRWERRDGEMVNALEIEIRFHDGDYSWITGWKRKRVAWTRSKRPWEGEKRGHS